MAVAAVQGTSPATKTHAKKAFLVFHELYELFAAAAHLYAVRLTNGVIFL